jgi:hypothetical protein
MYQDKNPRKRDKGHMKRRASLRNRNIGIMEQWNDGLKELYLQDSTIPTFHYSRRNKEV